MIDITAGDPKKVVSLNKEISFFGGNKQQISLIVNNTDAVFVNDQQLSFLSGILTACKLTLEDVALINIASHPKLSYKNIAENFNAKFVIMFGILADAIQLPFIMPEFQKQSYNNEVYIAVPSLTALENDKELKRKLWNVLKEIFSL